MEKLTSLIDQEKELDSVNKKQKRTNKHVHFFLFVRNIL